MMGNTDLLGRSLDQSEERLRQVYHALKALAADPQLSPCAERNTKKALACMWQVVNDLDLEYEQLYELGV